MNWSDTTDGTKMWLFKHWHTPQVSKWFTWPLWPHGKSFESGHFVSSWPSFIRLLIHPGLCTVQPGSGDVGTADDGLTEEGTTRIGLKPVDELCDLVRYASLPKTSPPLLLPLSFPHTRAFCCFLKIYNTFFIFINLLSKSTASYPHASRVLLAWRSFYLSFYPCISFPLSARFFHFFTNN